jgi:hypothetical protein
MLTPADADAVAIVARTLINARKPVPTHPPGMDAYDLLTSWATMDVGDAVQSGIHPDAIDVARAELDSAHREARAALDANAAFIAAARQDVPALLDEVERLRARVAELERETEQLATAYRNL